MSMYCPIAPICFLRLPSGGCTFKVAFVCHRHRDYYLRLCCITATTSRMDLWYTLSAVTFECFLTAPKHTQSAAVCPLSNIKSKSVRKSLPTFSHWSLQNPSDCARERTYCTSGTWAHSPLCAAHSSSPLLMAKWPKLQLFSTPSTCALEYWSNGMEN